ncbi:MAG: hypothetical protein NC924_03290 [Candidatus Omnitrophica bacterium]|nr:hypothetical protein [Candidatus Omnitrophota bacterium]
MKKRVTILDKAEAAMKKAVKKVVAQHKKDGRPLVIWEEGKVRKFVVR